jgi:hypothetical protein
VNPNFDKRLGSLERRIEPLRPRLDPPEWLAWTTCRELSELEEIYRAAVTTDAAELSERDCHRVMSIYAAASVRMLEAPPEVRADPRSRDAYVREIEDPDRPSWGPPSNPDVGR